MAWTWDEDKARQNQAKHGVSFELAERALADPDALSRLDAGQHGEERWQTIGKPVLSSLTLLVIHTEEGSEVPGRIISARRATPHERRQYEQRTFDEG